MAETLAKKFNVNVLTADAFKSIPKGSGNILSDFSLETPKIDETNVIHATQGGVKITYQNTIEDSLAEIDNAPTNTKQGAEVTGTTATISYTTPNADPKTIQMAVGTADIDPEDQTHVVARLKTALTDFKPIWWVGPMIGNGFLAVKIYNALSTGGLDLQSAHRGGGSMQITLTAFADLENPEQAPMEFYSITKAASEV